jgi:hypothetical protein
MEIKFAEDRDVGWNTRSFFSPAVRRRRGHFKYVCLEFDSFDLIERNLILRPIIKLRSPR